MNKSQILVISGGVILVLALFFFGRTVAHKSDIASVQSEHSDTPTFDIKALLASEKSKLSLPQQTYVNSLESSVVRGDVKIQQTRIFRQLAGYWKDSVQSVEAYAYYTGEASKLENSEKSLTFAAQLFLNNLRRVGDPGIKSWMASEAKDLFQKALLINPSNDSARIGLGSAYIFGSSAENPQEVMQGIQQIIKVSQKDSSNMYAQLMLGLGGVVSGQYEKAIPRLKKVLAFEPGNLEALLTIAEAYERSGDKENAKKSYETARKMITMPEVLKEIDHRIQQLK
ncbi:MAG: tetratricopeptide repeat protein [Chitinophagaceae bacterium]